MPSHRLNSIFCFRCFLFLICLWMESSSFNLQVFWQDVQQLQFCNKNSRTKAMAIKSPFKFILHLISWSVLLRVRSCCDDSRGRSWEEEEAHCKNSCQSFLESWLPSIAHCRFPFWSVAFSSLCRWYRYCSGDFRKRECLDCRGAWWTMRRHRIVVTRSLVPLVGAPEWCPCPQSKSKLGFVGAGVWWW